MLFNKLLISGLLRFPEGAEGGSGGATPTLGGAEPTNTGAEPKDTGNGDEPANVEYTLEYGESFSGTDDDKKFLNDLGKKHGIDAKQLSAFISDYDGSLVESRHKSSIELAQANEKAWNELATEWGAEYESKTNKAIEASKHIAKLAGLDDSVFKDLGIHNSPVAFKIFNAISSLISESPSVGTNAGNNAGTPKAQEILDNPSHPLHKALFDVKHEKHAEVWALLSK